MKKFKIVSFIGLLLFILTIFSGCSTGNSESSSSVSNNGKYKNHITFDILTIDNLEHMDSIPLLQQASVKFNCSFKQKLVSWDSWDTEVNTLVASNALPDILAWYDLNYGQYLNWVNKGIFKPILDLNNYPNLNKLVSIYNIDDYLKINGKLYALPKVINDNPYNEISPLQFIYRRDWAKDLGYNWGATQAVTWSQFMQFLYNVKTKDPGNEGANLIPLDTDSGYESLNNLLAEWNPNGAFDYIKENGKYVWSGSNPSTITGLNAIKNMIDNGYLPKDYYSYNNDDGNNRFTAGRTAVLLSRQNVVGITGLIENLEKSSPSIKQNDVGYLAVQAPDGTYHETEKMEWWGSFAFSSKCSDEEENRFMDFGNWILSTDNMETAAYGIKGVDWNQDSSGKITLNWPFDASGNPSFSQNISKAYVGWDQTVQKWFVLEGFDVYLPGNPVYSNYVKNAFKDVVTIEKKNLTLQTDDYNVDFFSAPDKNQYGNFSNDAIDAITKAVASPDPGKSWNDFVSSIQPKLNSVLNEINKGAK